MKTKEKAICQVCGEPMPEGEEMFNYHGYSCPCPKTPSKQATSMKTKEEIFEEYRFPPEIDSLKDAILMAMEEYNVQFQNALINWFKEYDSDEIERIERIIEGIKTDNKINKL